MEFWLLGGLLFGLPLVLQMILLAAVERRMLRWSGLLCPILLFVLALMALMADETHSFISLKTAVSAALAGAGLLSLAGCGCGWLAWKLLLRGRR